MLRFRTFGAIDVRTGDGERVASLLDQPKRLALLAVLSARPVDELVPREKLCSVLWPERSPSAGRSALNTTLSRLRGDLGEEIFQDSGSATVGLSTDHFRSDVQKFLEAVDTGRHRRAADLYRGPFLEGFGLPGNRAFEEWLDRRRDRYRHLAFRSALEAGETARTDENLEEAEAAFRKALDIEPVNEEAAAGLIRVLAARGRPSDACRFYDRYRVRRRTETDLPPSSELQRLIDQLRRPRPVPEETPPSGEEADPEAAGPRMKEDEASPSSSSATAKRDDGESGTLPVTSMRALVLVLVGVVAAGAIVAYTALHGDTADPSRPERSVAVLPFHVAGSAEQGWEDGMVTVLTSSLDGVGGVRAIADRTVLATWGQVSARGGGGSRESVLFAARELGAVYAVTGSVVEVASELRFSAELLRTDSGRSIGQIEVRGAADSAAALADELARRVIGVLEQRTDEAVRRAEVASLNTRSVEALKAYLEGERHLRIGEAEEAMEAFHASVRADSSFALPYARLGLYGFWREEGADRYTRKAFELADRLPPRDRRLIRALYLAQVEHRTVAAADSFRRLARDYPDDPSVWSSLGEFVFHTHVARGLGEVEAAHERAVALDPGHTAYYDHYVGPAYTLHHDSTLATNRVEAMPESEWKRMHRLALDLVFGSPATKKQALNRFDTARIHEPWLAFGPLEGPEEKETLDALLRRLVERDDLSAGNYVPLIFLNDLHRGRVQQALDDSNTFGLPRTFTSCFYAHSMTLGYPIPDSIARAQLAPENLSDDPSTIRLRCSALYLIERGRVDRADALIERIRSLAASWGAGEVTAGERAAVVQELRGYRAWKAGDLERAARLLGRSNESRDAGAIWRGDLYRELGQLERAEGWYRVAWRHPLAYQRLGRLYEAMGQPEEAAIAYRRFITAWDDADGELQRRVESARKRIRALSTTAS